ncbi:hypothetical protein B0H14DRAFT_2557673 [Mycena olivaceomarginata]|nr:hypothetical protein B0H14DRAFT_2557673 [Mycena olivaceomarginata]
MLRYRDGVRGKGEERGCATRNDDEVRSRELEATGSGDGLKRRRRELYATAVKGGPGAGRRGEAGVVVGGVRAFLARQLLVGVVARLVRVMARLVGVVARWRLRCFKNRVAAETRKKQDEKTAEAAAEQVRLQAIVVITDAGKLAALPVRKKGGLNLREQLDVRRELWKDEMLCITTLAKISKKADMLAAILAADRQIDVFASQSADSIVRMATTKIQRVELNIETAWNSGSQDRGMGFKNYET